MSAHGESLHHNICKASCIHVKKCISYFNLQIDAGFEDAMTEAVFYKYGAPGENTTTNAWDDMQYSVSNNPILNFSFGIVSMNMHALLINNIASVRLHSNFLRYIFYIMNFD